MMTFEQRRVHGCGNGSVQVYGTASWDHSLESCQAQSSCKGVKPFKQKTVVGGEITAAKATP